MPLIGSIRQLRIRTTSVNVSLYWLSSYNNSTKTLSFLPDVRSRMGEFQHQISEIAADGFEVNLNLRVACRNSWRIPSWRQQPQV